MLGSGTDPAVHLYPCWDNAPVSPQRGLRTPAGEGLTVSELSLSTEEITLFFGMFSFSKLKARPAMGLLCLLPCILSTLGLGTHRWRRSAQAGHFYGIHTGLFQNVETLLQPVLLWGGWHGGWCWRIILQLCFLGGGRALRAHTCLSPVSSYYSHGLISISFLLGLQGKDKPLLLQRKLWSFAHKLTLWGAGM